MSELTSIQTTYTAMILAQYPLHIYFLKYAQLEIAQYYRGIAMPDKYKATPNPNTNYNRLSLAWLTLNRLTREFIKAKTILVICEHAGVRRSVVIIVVIIIF